VGRRASLLLLVLTLAAGPLLWLVFGGSAPAQPVPAKPKAAAVQSTACKERTLAYGLSDDPRAQSEALFGAHPPLPRPGYYGPEDGPDPQAVLHAVTHRWVVVKYRPGVDARRLAKGPRTLVISGGPNMPFALGAVAWGAQLTCATPDLSAVAAFVRASSSTA
jgi:hypothetical protein